MSSKLVPSDPTSAMVIRDLAPNITTFSVPFLRFGRIKIGGRATLVKMQTGNFAVFSPVALTDTVKELVSKQGKVAYIVAPDMEHHIFLSAWAKEWPAATIIAPEGLYEKRAEQAKTGDPNITDLPIQVIFTKQDKESIRVDSAFDREFAYEYVDAHPNKELVFLHRPSRTLIQADLLFNLPATEQYSRTADSPTTGLFTRLFGALQNTQGTALWQKRMLWYALSRGDRPGFNRSVGRIDEWDFDNLVPCHGDSIVGGAKGVWSKVMAWHIEAAKKQGSAPAS